jgi:hypothetical protein
MLQKLILVGEPKKKEVDCILVSLVLVSRNIRMIDFKTPRSKVGVDIFKPLLSVAREVMANGEVLCYRGSGVASGHLTRKPRTPTEK